MVQGSVKRTKNISGIIFLASLLAYIIYLLTANEVVLLAAGVALNLSAVVFTVFWMHEREKAKKTGLYLWIATVVTSGIVTGIVAIVEDILDMIAGAVFISIPFILLGGVLFVHYRKKIWVYTGVLLLLITGLVLKRLAIPGGGIILTAACCLFGYGFIMLALNSILTIRKNTYLSIAAFLMYLTMAIVAGAIVAKIQHMPGGGILMRTNVYPVLFLTVLVLASLPFSGFTDWIRDHKRVFTRNILYPWIVFLFLASSQYLLPERVFNTIFPTGQQRPDEHFGMRYYELEEEPPQDTGEDQ